MDQKQIQRQVDVFVEKTTKRMNVQKIYLYGSALSNKAQPHDVDLIVVGHFPTDDPESFLYDLYTDIPRMLDFHVYGIDSNRSILSPFLEQAISEGSVIYSSK